MVGSVPIEFLGARYKTEGNTKAMHFQTSSLFHARTVANWEKNIKDKFDIFQALFSSLSGSSDELHCFTYVHFSARNEAITREGTRLYRIDCNTI